MKRFALFPSVCLLLCASVAPLYAGIPPMRWFPAHPVKLPAVNTALKKATANLARVSVPGYAYSLSQKTNREFFLEKGTLGLNMHKAVALHESLFPNTKGTLLSTQFSKMAETEKNIALLIDEESYLNWTAPKGFSRVALFESALPAYLIEPNGEDVFVPSAEQLEEALSFYREVLGAGENSGLPFSGKFGGAMSAVSNLSLLGNQQDAPLILYTAKKDFENANPFVDYFIIRALIALDAKKELKELADYRVEQAQGQAGQLVPLWRDINEDYKLNISDHLIAREEAAPLPEYVQKDLILHHPFNYVLLNPSAEVTRQWVKLRAGIHAQIKAALAQEAAPQADEKSAQAAVQEKRFVFNEPVARASEAATTPVQGKPALDLNIALYQTDKLLRKALQEDLANKAAIKKAIKEQLQADLQTASSFTPPIQRAKPQTKAEVRQALEDYIAKYDQFPPSGSKLYSQVYGIVTKPFSADPDVKIIKEAYKQYQEKKKITPAKTLEELKAYVEEHDGKIPPVDTPLRARVQRFLKSQPNDPAVQEMSILWNTHKASTKTVTNTPKHVRERLEAYLAETQNLFPHPGTSLRNIINTILRKSDPNDPDVQAIRALHKEFVVNTVNTAPTPSKKPEQWLEELEAFLKQNKRLPSTTSADPAERKLATAVTGIRKRIKTAKKFNRAAQKIANLLNDYTYYKVTTIEKPLESLKEFLAKEGRIPSTDSPNREERLLAEKMYDIRAKVLRGINTDEASLEVAFIVEQYRSQKKNL